MAARKKAAKKAPKKAAKKAAKKAPTVSRVTARPRRTAAQNAAQLVNTVSPKRIREILSGERKRLIAIKRAGLIRVREDAKRGRVRVKERRKAQRERLLRMWSRNQAAELDRLDRTIRERKAAIMATFDRGTARNRALAEAVRDAKRQKAEAKRRARSPAQLRAAIKAQERRDENLSRARDEVESTAPRLLPYFDKVKAKLRAKKNISLAEQFFQLAQENTDAALLASQRDADRQVAELVRQGEPRWNTQARRIEGAICNKATKAAKAGKLYKLPARERTALSKLGIDAGPLMSRCYNDAVSRRRVVSARMAAAPF